LHCQERGNCGGIWPAIFIISITSGDSCRQRSGKITGGVAIVTVLDYAQVRIGEGEPES
jgi:hypothetical protein